MSIIRAINKFYEDKEKRGWVKGYFFFDIHGTILRPNYQYGNTPKDFYPNSIEALQLMTQMPEICMILYTCSHPHERKEYLQLFEDHGIHFEYINENPEVVTDITGYGCYDTKPYMSVLFEDKASFDPEKEWEEVLYFFKDLNTNINSLNENKLKEYSTEDIAYGLIEVVKDSIQNNTFKHYKGGGKDLLNNRIRKYDVICWFSLAAYPYFMVAMDIDDSGFCVFQYCDADGTICEKKF